MLGRGSEGAGDKRRTHRGLGAGHEQSTAGGCGPRTSPGFLTGWKPQELSRGVALFRLLSGFRPARYERRVKVGRSKIVARTETCGRWHRGSMEMRKMDAKRKDLTQRVQSIGRYP